MRQSRGERRKSGVPVDDDDASVAANVAERLVVRTGDDMTTIAAHETELRRQGGRRNRGVFPRIGVTGARRGIY